MTDQSSSNKGERLPGTSLPGQDKLESLLCALIELKSNISLVEQQHPALGNDLSALCDLVLDHLNRSEELTMSPRAQPELISSHSHPDGGNLPDNPTGPASTCADKELVPLIRESDTSVNREMQEMPSQDRAGSFNVPPDDHRTYQEPGSQETHRKDNILSSIFDRAGDRLVTGLDKMGDGVIFVFEKLLSLSAQKKTEPTEDDC